MPGFPYWRHSNPVIARVGVPSRLGLGLALALILVLAALLCIALAVTALHSARVEAGGDQRLAALYPKDERRELSGADYERYPGAGVLFCRADGIPRKAAAAWLIGNQRLVVLNAHNFRSRHLERTREVADCFFQIGGRNYDFAPETLRLGTAPGAMSLHITDDWALLDLAEAAENVRPQPIPASPDLPTGTATIPVVMVSPGGHANYAGQTSLERCAIRQIDPPSEDAIRRVRHDCNNGFGGSGSGLFDESGRLVALHSASLSMNSRRIFDLEYHYGSAMMFEGALLDAIRTRVAAEPAKPPVR
ncbi:trypsin-like peptidase domain-containing protein [Methylobacterium sp. J-068]|uniref:trypsin-like peptidase domain-containing protein n=1 Tax=Methylobacterium sp. J-068 TaxID=2836649 RepID=UPI001FB9B789|nr:trypsin-like peptidase domain-containing protein [Methylobacterium sp. J-068]MCJ2034496.1 trypsin-like peptidase domain-containing protein [Methylobacterium sp. J-068]